ncbi:MAG: YncE family protein, partial [Candidatus Methylomirabilales bacterium]
YRVATPGRPFDIDIDRSSGRVYVVRTNSSKLSVFEGDTGRVSREVDLGQAPKAVKVDEGRARVYSANRGGKSVTVVGL